MDEYLVWLLILIEVGVVISNIMVLKYTGKNSGIQYTNIKTEDDSDQEPDKKD